MTCTTGPGADFKVTKTVLAHKCVASLVTAVGTHDMRARGSISFRGAKHRLADAVLAKQQNVHRQGRQAPAQR